VHDRIDEIIYVLAGQGSVRIEEETHPLKPGSLAVVPHGTAHALDRVGKNPLVLVSALVGSPCEPAKAAARP
jgi:quercetin dioxygenase-like cupin family protein